MRTFALNIAQKRLVAGLRLDPTDSLAVLRGKGEDGKGEGR